MNCESVRERLELYLDGELDINECRDIEAHLRACRVCESIARNQQALSRAVKAKAAYHTAPPELLDKIQLGLSTTPTGLTIARPQRVLTVAAALAAAVVLTWSVALITLRTAPEQPFADEVIAGHVRSLLAQHLTDVASSDQHTVKPWFAGKLDFSPPVDDFATRGYPLIGGRLDYLGGRAVAALIYKRRKHTINVFIWPMTGVGTPSTQHLTQQGYQLIRFARQGMNYWIISDLNSTELEQFAQLLETSF